MVLNFAHALPNRDGTLISGKQREPLGISTETQYWASQQSRRSDMASPLEQLPKQRMYKALSLFVSHQALALPA